MYAKMQKKWQNYCVCEKKIVPLQRFCARVRSRAHKTIYIIGATITTFNKNQWKK